MPAEGTSRTITFLSLGSGPDFQSSKRMNTLSCPGFHDSSLNAPPPASLFLSHSIAHGSLAVACFFASSALMMTGTGTAMSGSVSRSFLRKLILNVASSTTTNCSGFSSDPAFIWKVGNPPTVTARSKDHFTSLAVTGVPS